MQSLVKIAANKLTKSMSYKTEGAIDHMGNKVTRHAFRRNDDLVGHVDVHNGQVTDSHVDKKYRGMGLGKKLYGRAMKHHGELKSDNYVSGDARGVWERMKKRKDYAVSTANDAKEYINKSDPDLGKSGLRPIEAKNSVYHGKIK